MAKISVCRYCGKEFEQPTYKCSNGETRIGNLIYCCDACMKAWEREHYSKTVCKYCGKVFYKAKTDYKRYSRTEFCSSECQHKYTQEHTKYYCQYCYKELDGYKEVKNRFCSKECKTMKNSRFNRVCVNCGKSFDVTKKNANGSYNLNQRFCCDECEQQFTEKRKQKLSKKYYCQFCGKEIIGNYKNGEKLKNKYCSESCVKAAVEREKKEFTKKVICKQCGKEFEICERTKIGDLKRDKFCSELCRFTYRSEHQKSLWKNKTIEQITLEQRKREQTNIERYGVPYTCLLSDYDHENNTAISDMNKIFANCLNSIDLSVEFEFVINKYAYDIHIKDTNILIELNPSYTHSIVPSHWDLIKGKNIGKTKEYHLDKTNYAKEQGYRCINVWQWDNIQKVIQLVIKKTKVFARKLDLVEILDKREVNAFLDKYHLQSSCYGNQVNLGLYKDNELVQVMTFGKPRYNKNYQWELLRLCSGDYMIVGGAEKLFKYFINNYNPESIISYCDVSKFNGDVYNRLGFDLLRQTAPQKIWNKEKQYITDNLLRQRGADQLIGTHDGKGTNNEEIMLREGWLPVYDCGQYVFEWDRSKFMI